MVGVKFSKYSKQYVILLFPPIPPVSWSENLTDSMVQQVVYSMTNKFTPTQCILRFIPFFVNKKLEYCEFCSAIKDIFIPR